MFYEIVVVLAVLITVFQISTLYKVRKHDRILYRICQIRRDAMNVLRQRGLELGRDDYGELRVMIEVMNTAIENYKDHRMIIFNFRSMWSYFKVYKNNTKNIVRYEPTDKEILQIRDALIRAILRGFLTYTPLLGLELRYDSFRIFFSFVAEFLMRIRILKKSTLRRIKEVRSQLISDILKYGYPNNSLRHHHCGALKN